jgi:hypothetical protein
MAAPAMRGGPEPAGHGQGLIRRADGHIDDYLRGDLKYGS